MLAAVVRYRRVSPDPTGWTESPMRDLGNDAWEGELRLGPLAATGRVQRAARRSDAPGGRGGPRRPGPGRRSAAIGGTGARVDRPIFRSSATALDPHTADLASRYLDRTIASRLDRELPIRADRERAEVGAWYELFPCSASRDERRHGTFSDVVRLLPKIADLGFDVLYLPPIHPIGRTHRKGKNNSLLAGPDDVGSPWAIGSAEGGHKSVHPRLGTLDDFRALVRAAAASGIEIALDLAFQCSPDHSYVREPPEWFLRRPDGSIKFAEIPRSGTRTSSISTGWGPPARRCGPSWPTWCDSGSPRA